MACHTPQRTPTMRVPTTGPKRSSRRGSAKPAPARLLAERAADDERGPDEEEHVAEERRDRVDRLERAKHARHQQRTDGGDRGYADQRPDVPAHTDAPDQEPLEEVDHAGPALRGAGHDHRCEHRSEEGRGSDVDEDVERAGVGEHTPGIGRQVVDEKHRPRPGERQHEIACQRIPADDIALPVRDRCPGARDSGHDLSFPSVAAPEHGCGFTCPDRRLGRKGEVGGQNGRNTPPHSAGAARAGSTLRCGACVILLHPRMT